MVNNRILVVDDEDIMREVNSESLAAKGYEVSEASDGGEALEAHNEARNMGGIHLIVSDIRMPNMDGFELFEKIRESGSNVPFVFVSGNYEHDERAQQILSQSGFLRKPYKMDELVSKVYSILNPRP